RAVGDDDEVVGRLLLGGNSRRPASEEERGGQHGRQHAIESTLPHHGNLPTHVEFPFQPNARAASSSVGRTNSPRASLPLRPTDVMCRSNIHVRSPAESKPPPPPHRRAGKGEASRSLRGPQRYRHAAFHLFGIAPPLSCSGNYCIQRCMSLEIGRA